MSDAVTISRQQVWRLTFHKEIQADPVYRINRFWELAENRLSDVIDPGWSVTGVKKVKTKQARRQCDEIVYAVVTESKEVRLP